MRVEISHDILAKKIFNKASSEDRAYLRALKIIKDRHKSFSDTKTYLTQRELDFIGGYDKSLDIDLTEEELKFIRQSKRYLTNRLWLKITSYVIIGVVVGIIILSLNIRYSEKFQELIGLNTKNQRANKYIATALQLMDEYPTKAFAYTNEAKKLTNSVNSSANLLRQLVFDNNIFYKHIFKQKEGSHAIAVSHELKLIATAYKNGKIYLWRTDSLKTVPQDSLIGHSKNVNDLSFLGTNNLVSVSDDNLALVWNLTTKRRDTLNSTKLEPNQLNAVFTTSRDPSIILTAGGGNDKNGYVWKYNSTTGEKKLEHILEHGIKLFDISLSPNSIEIKRKKVHIIATIGIDENASGRKIKRKEGEERACLKLWNSETGALIIKQESVEGITAVDFHPTKNWVVISSRDKNIYIFEFDKKDPNKLKLILQKEVHANSVRHVTFSPLGDLLLTSGWDNKAKVWRIKEKPAYKLELLHTLKGHENRVFKSLFTLDQNAVITTSTDSTTRIWKLDNKKPKVVFNKHKARASSVDISGDLIVSGGWDETINIYNKDTRDSISIPSPNKKDVEWVQFLPGSKKEFLAVAGENIYKFDTTGQQLFTEEYKHNGTTIKAAAFCDHIHNDGDHEHKDYLATGSRDGVVKCWEISGNKLIYTHIYKPKKEFDIFSLAFSPDGNYLAVGRGNGQIDLIKHPTTTASLSYKSIPAALEILHEETEAHSQEVFTLVFISENTLLSAGRDNTIKIWTISEKDIVTAKDAKKIITNTSITNTKTLIAHTNSVRSLTKNKKNPYLVLSTGGDGTVQIWNMKSLTYQEIDVHDDVKQFCSSLSIDCPLVLKAAFSDDGNYIVTANGDGSVKLFYTLEGLLDAKEIYSDFEIEPIDGE